MYMDMDMLATREVAIEHLDANVGGRGSSSFEVMHDGCGDGGVWGAAEFWARSESALWIRIRPQACDWAVSLGLRLDIDPRLSTLEARRRRRQGSREL